MAEGKVEEGDERVFILKLYADFQGRLRDVWEARSEGVLGGMDKASGIPSFPLRA